MFFISLPMLFLSQDHSLFLHLDMHMLLILTLFHMWSLCPPVDSIVRMRCPHKFSLSLHSGVLFYASNSKTVALIPELFGFCNYRMFSLSALFVKPFLLFRLWSVSPL